jgi:uncharacterized membrane protein (DUF106 family)
MNGLMTPFLSITLISIALSLLIAVIYRLLTKPGAIRKSKEDMKFYKAKMAEAQKAGDRQKSNEYASEMLRSSQLQFRHTMKPMMVTMLVFFLLLGWLNSTYGGITADLGKNPNATFSYAGVTHKIQYYKVEGNGSVTMRAGIDLNDDGMFSNDEIFDQGAVFTYKETFWRVGPVVEGFFIFGGAPKENTVHFEMLIAKAPFAIPLIGSYLSWFWWYVLLSIPATMLFRKMLGVE